MTEPVQRGTRVPVLPTPRDSRPAPTWGGGEAPGPVKGRVDVLPGSDEGWMGTGEDRGVRTG